jgi:hypothetical protein
MDHKKMTNNYVDMYFKPLKEGETTRECFACSSSIRNHSATNFMNHIKQKHSDYASVFDSMKRASAGGDLRQKFVVPKNILLLSTIG